MPFLIRQRVDLADFACHFSLRAERPQVVFSGLSAGVDNLRHDVFLSPKMAQAARAHIARLIASFGDVTDIAAEKVQVGAAPVVGVRRERETVPELRTVLTELLLSALKRAKAEENISVDLLCRFATIKFLRAEISAQFTTVLERCRTRVKSYDDNPRNASGKAIEVREKTAALQLAKRSITRRTGQELLEMLRQIERESVCPLRRSLFGVGSEFGYEILRNTLLFTDDGRDDFLNAQFYVMLGNYDRDRDRFGPMTDIACGFLESLGFADDLVDDLLSVPENAAALMGSGEASATKEQKLVLAAWVDTLEREDVVNHVIAAYEVASLLPEFSPVINPQQLKYGLMSRSERKVVERLIEEHGKLDIESFRSAVKRVGNCYGGDRARIAARFFADFIRYHRDVRRLEVTNGALDSINLINSDRLRELSALNNTLYEFLLPEEQKPAEQKVVHHVIIKADIRDSTALTRTLFERGLNPASYFSLNFYEPISKLLPKYGARKVFIEGDAVILALFEYEGETGIGVGRACALAREIVDIVRAYNEQSTNANLPTLEIGIGITYQDSAPMYLVDDGAQIMISPALNASDRLSSCSKSARKIFAGVDSIFNVFCFQTIADEDTAGQVDEFLMRYNIGGINLNEAAFRKLQSEIALSSLDVDLPTLWEEDKIRLYSGSVAVAPGISHPLVIRESRIAHIDARDFHLIEWTSRKYYEVCTTDVVYDYVATLAAAQHRA